MIGELSYVIGASACGIAGVSGVIVLCNQYSEDQQCLPVLPFKKWLRKNIFKILFIGLLFSIGYAMLVALYTRHFYMGDQDALNSWWFELRTVPVTICVVGLAWDMCWRVIRWLIGIDKDLSW